tara:strand:+ start:861 stop:1172 length:312 start_codon:yes stop_codon:yes gene_type:complete
MKKQTLLYFAMNQNEQICLPARNFIGMEPNAAAGVDISFMEEDGTAGKVLMDCHIDTNSTIKEASKLLAAALAGDEKGKLLTIADDVNGVYLYPFVSCESISA